MLALSAALAAACFVKAFGVTFLGRARSAAAAQAREVDRFSLGAMFALAGLCVFAGVFPGARHRRAGAGRHGADGRAYAGADEHPVAHDRAGERGAGAPTTVSWSCCSCSLGRPRRPTSSTASPRMRVRRAAGLGLRLSRSEPDHAVHRRQLRPADPPRVRHDGVSRPREVDMPPPGELRPARLHVRLQRSGLGRLLRADRRCRRASPPIA